MAIQSFNSLAGYSVGESSMLVIDTNADITANTVSSGNIIPSADNTYLLGNATNRWANIWLGQGTIYMTDTANASNTAALTVANGILQVNGVTGLQANLISGTTTLNLANSGAISMSVANTANVLTVNTGNISVIGNVVATGNVSANYIKGDGSYLSNINVANVVGAYSNANVANYLPVYTGNVSASNISASGNVSVGNITITGNISATPIYASVWSNVTQNTVSNTIQVLTYNNIAGHNGIVLGNGASNSQLIVNHAGIYNLQFSIQLYKTSSSLDDVYIWARKNGNDLANTTGFFQVDRRTAAVQSWNFIVDAANVGDYFELASASTDASITFPAYPQQATPYTRPEIPSIIVTLTPVGA